MTDGVQGTCLVLAPEVLGPPCGESYRAARPSDFASRTAGHLSRCRQVPHVQTRAGARKQILEARAVVHEGLTQIFGRRSEGRVGRPRCDLMGLAVMVDNR